MCGCTSSPHLRGPIVDAPCTDCVPPCRAPRLQPSPAPLNPTPLQSSDLEAQVQLLTTKLDAMVCQHEYVVEDLRVKLRAADADKAAALALATRKDAEVAEVGRPVHGHLHCPRVR